MVKAIRRRNERGTPTTLTDSVTTVKKPARRDLGKRSCVRGL
jgi:hypothetical protein